MSSGSGLCGVPFTSRGDQTGSASDGVAAWMIGPWQALARDLDRGALGEVRRHPGDRAVVDSDAAVRAGGAERVREAGAVAAVDRDRPGRRRS